MSESRIHMEIRGRIVSVEGTEDFVKSMWSELKPLFLTDGEPEEAGSDEPTNPAKIPKAQPKRSSKPSSAKPKAVRPRGAALAKIRDLNLSATADVPAFADFYAEKAPRMHYERNAVIVFYLYKLRGLQVTPEHVYTCYEHLGEPSPTAFVQSLRDTAGSRKWIDVSDLEDIRTTIAGDNYVRGQLPAKDGGK